MDLASIVIDKIIQFNPINKEVYLIQNELCFTIDKIFSNIDQLYYYLKNKFKVFYLCKSNGSTIYDITYITNIAILSDTINKWKNKDIYVHSDERLKHRLTKYRIIVKQLNK